MELGDVLFSYDTAHPLAPIAIFSGAANSLLLRSDFGVGNWADILGTEPYIRAAERGLTLGGWFWWSAKPGVLQYLIGKDDTGFGRSYRVIVTAANLIQFTVWPGPVSVTSAATINAGWNHCTGIYDQPSQTLYVELNGVITAGGAGAAPAALADQTSSFIIGADGAGGNRFAGYASMCFLCACSLTGGVPPTCAHIRALRQKTKALYGVK